LSEERNQSSLSLGCTKRAGGRSPDSKKYIEVRRVIGDEDGRLGRAQFPANAGWDRRPGEKKHHSAGHLPVDVGGKDAQATTREQDEENRKEAGRDRY